MDRCLVGDRVGRVQLSLALEFMQDVADRRVHYRVARCRVEEDGVDHGMVCCDVLQRLSQDARNLLEAAVQAVGDHEVKVFLVNTIGEQEPPYGDAVRLWVAHGLGLQLRKCDDRRVENRHVAHVFREQIAWVGSLESTQRRRGRTLRRGRVVATRRRDAKAAVQCKGAMCRQALEVSLRLDVALLLRKPAAPQAPCHPVAKTQ